MRLSEAMELGHMLISETQTFYNPYNNCGCALGSVVAAVFGKEGKGLDFRVASFSREENKLTQKFPALHCEINLNGEPSYSNLAYNISKEHCRGVKRLEIAKRLRKLEDEGKIPWIKDDTNIKEIVNKGAVHGHHQSNRS